MVTIYPDIDELKRHLLGKTRGDARERLDLQILCDEGSLDDELAAALDELHDDMAWGRLSWWDRRRFLRRFRPSPESVLKRRVAEGLKGYVERLDTTAAADDKTTSYQGFMNQLAAFLEWTAAPAWKYALAGLVLASVVGNLWLFTEWRGIVDGPRGVVVAEIVDLKPASMVRDGVRVSLHESGLIRLRMDIGVAEHTEYLATLAGEGGSEFWSQRELRAVEVDGTSVVEVVLPSELLQSGLNVIELSGFTADGGLEAVESYRIAGAAE